MSGCSLGGGTIGTGFPAHGGGTSGTGLNFGGVPSAEDEIGVSYFNLEASVRDSNGKPLSGITVKVETGRDHDTTETNEDGTFDISVVAREGEDITFTFFAGGKETTFVQKKVPANVSGASFDFVLTKAGKVLLKKKSFSSNAQ